MKLPEGATPLPFPVHLKPWMAGHFKSTRDEMRTVFGDPHFVETDEMRTLGGDQDNWAWELISGQRVLLVLEVMSEYVEVICDPPDINAVFEHFEVNADGQQAVSYSEPMLDPGYSGP